MKLFRLVFLVFIILTCCKKKDKTNHQQIEINTELKNKLEKILLRDQGIRQIVNGNLTKEQKTKLYAKLNLKELEFEGNDTFELMRKIDSINIIEVEKIVEKYGYPSKSMVGEPANIAVFYVVQHSEKIDKYLPIIREASKNGDISKAALAMMEDRNLMNQGREQIYGTQIRGQESKSGKWIYFLWPLKNADSVNIWRKQVGFEQNVEEYVKDMDVEFKLYTINDLKDL